VKRYLVTWAQNATPVHANFFAAAKVFCKVEGAELIGVAGRYRNPTSRSDRFASDDEWAEEILPHLAARPRRDGEVCVQEPVRRRLAPSLMLFSDVVVPATATQPLSGFEVFAGKDSAIFGHCKRSMVVVPTSTRMPRVQWTTGAITVPNYSDSKAGKKARAHHVLGALVVEVDDDGIFFVRQVTANARTGTFYDLKWKYTTRGRFRAERIETLTMGDYHAGREDEEVLEATEKLVELLQPKAIVAHDLFDGMSCNPHEVKSKRHRYLGRFDTVKAEVEHCGLGAANRIAGWGKADHRVIVAWSNHDDFLWRWLESFDPDRDPKNAPYYHQLWATAYAYQAKHGCFPNVLAEEFKRLKVNRRVRFLGRDESFKRKDVEHLFHGHNGINGARSNAKAFARLGVKLSKGHEHTPGIWDGAWCAGVKATLDHGYNPLPSTWMHADIVLHADGKRQMVFYFKGRFRGGMDKS
jgi:hypothetical protein